MKKVVYFLLVALCMEAYAQEELLTPVNPIMRYVEGQVITLEGDTLTGEIRARNKGMSTYINRIQFKDQNGDERYYFPEDITGFIQERDNLAVLGGSNSVQSTDQKFVYYDSFNHPSKKKNTIFAQRLINGDKMRLYENPTGSSNSTSLGGFTISENERTYLVSKNGGELTRLHKGQFENMLEELFYDCEALKNELESNKKMKDFRYIGDIVVKYNQCE